MQLTLPQPVPIPLQPTDSRRPSACSFNGKIFPEDLRGPGAVGGPGEAPTVMKGLEKAVTVVMSGLRRSNLSVSSSNFANKAESHRPHLFHLKMGIKSKQLTLGSTDLNQVDHILMFQKLEDLDFPQGCNGELCGRRKEGDQK